MRGPPPPPPPTQNPPPPRHPPPGPRAPRAPAAAPPGARGAPPAALLPGGEEGRLGGAPAAVPREDARRDHSRVVDDHAVARTQELRELGKRAVLERAAGAVDHEEPRGVTGGGGRLRDRIGRQLVIEIVGRHHGQCTAGRWPGPPVASREAEI